MKFSLPAKIAITILFVSSIFVTSALWNAVSAASVTHIKYNCGGWTAELQSEGGPITASFLPEVGTWIEIPTNDRSADDLNIYFLNIETKKIAVMGVNRKNQIFLQTFRNHSAYKLNRIEHSLLCRR